MQLMTSAEAAARVAAMGLTEHCREAAAALPPLSPAQRARLRAISLAAAERERSAAA